MSKFGHYNLHFTVKCTWSKKSFP